MDGLILFIALIIFIGLACIPAFIAEKKGRSFALWFVYGFLLFIVALIHSLMIEPNEYAPGMKKCSECQKIISNEARVCSFCGARGEATLPNSIGAAVGAQAHVPPSTTTAVATSMVTSAVSASSSLIYTGERNLANQRYQAYLVKKYEVEKNPVLEKFLVGFDSFDDLVTALTFAHGQESASQRFEQPAPAAVAPMTEAPKARVVVPDARAVAVDASSLSERDQADLYKLKNYKYALVAIHSKAGVPTFTLKSTVNQDEFDLDGSEKLREFAAQF